MGDIQGLGALQLTLSGEAGGGDIPVDWPGGPVALPTG